MCHYASKKADCAEMVNCLQNHDGDFEKMNKNGDTPLQMARQLGHPVAFEKGREANLLFVVLVCLNFEFVSQKLSWTLLPNFLLPSIASL